MAHLVWTDDLNTGIDVIDDQHRQIVALINQLYDARQTNNRALVGEVIDGLVEYTISHFAFEESMMEDVSYEFVRPHKKVHELFVRRVADFQTRFKQGEDVADELHGLLARWLFNHIRHDDAAYVKAVKKDAQQLVQNKEEGGWLSRSLGRFFGRR